MALPTVNRCPKCGTDHRSFRVAYKCFDPLKQLMKMVRSHSPELQFNFSQMRAYLFKRFGGC